MFCLATQQGATAVERWQWWWPRCVSGLYYYTSLAVLLLFYCHAGYFTHFYLPAACLARLSAGHQINSELDRLRGGPTNCYQTNTATTCTHRTQALSLTKWLVKTGWDVFLYFQHIIYNSAGLVKVSSLRENLTRFCLSMEKEVFFQ